jgi:hypothetical protein
MGFASAALAQRIRSHSGCAAESYIDKTLGEPAHSAWRFGVLPWLSQTGRTFDALLLDDVNDARGPALLERWQKEFGVTVERLVSPEGECAIVRPPLLPRFTAGL